MAGPRPVRHLATYAACILLFAARAGAQASASEKAAAEALFDQGVRLLKQNSFAEACPKLEESQRIDPAVGTLLYLAECYERSGRTASAWATFREAASLATHSGQADRARIATSRAQDLEPKLSHLSVELAPDVASVPGVVVKRGDQRIEPSLYGTPLPVDPGEYVVQVSAPGYEPWSAPVKVEGGGGSATVRVPGLVKLPESKVPHPETPAAAVKAERRPAPPPHHEHGLTTQQTLGLFTGAVGVVGVGIGSYFGVRAIGHNSDAETHCSKPKLCEDGTGVDLTKKAQREATAANIAFAAGGVLVATGAVLYLTGSARESDSIALVPALSPDTAAASLRGRF